MRATGRSVGYVGVFAGWGVLDVRMLDEGRLHRLGQQPGPDLRLRRRWIAGRHPRGLGVRAATHGDPRRAGRALRRLPAAARQVDPVGLDETAASELRWAADRAGRSPAASGPGRRVSKRRGWRPPGYRLRSRISIGVPTGACTSIGTTPSQGGRRGWDGSPAPARDVARQRLDAPVRGDADGLRRDGRRGTERDGRQRGRLRPKRATRAPASTGSIIDSTLPGWSWFVRFAR